mmetsp:Transcript_60936/g.70762  ORF Transcript_60936/g.70762 Transcript_60936/m.70762 type:complete len:293 (+) Transcript_60936:214-1092(+)
MSSFSRFSTSDIRRESSSSRWRRTAIRLVTTLSLVGAAKMKRWLGVVPLRKETKGAAGTSGAVDVATADSKCESKVLYAASVKAGSESAQFMRSTTGATGSGTGSGTTSTSSATIFSGDAGITIVVGVAPSTMSCGGVASTSSDTTSTSSCATSSATSTGAASTCSTAATSGSAGVSSMTGSEATTVSVFLPLLFFFPSAFEVGRSTRTGAAATALGSTAVASLGASGAGANFVSIALYEKAAVVLPEFGAITTAAGTAGATGAATTSSFFFSAGLVLFGGIPEKCTNTYEQ